jgi:tetratricopeptide (TPR) repeat protein
MNAPTQAARLSRRLRDRRARISAGLFLLLALLLVPPAAAADLFLQARPFRGLVRRDTAEKMAVAAARQMAMQAAMRLLVKEPDFSFEAGGAPLPLEGLADRIYATEVVALEVQGFPPHMQAAAEVRLIPPKGLRKTLIEALRDPKSLELSALLLARRAELIAGCDLLAERILPLNPHAGEGREDSSRLQSLARNLEALEVYDQALRLHGSGWQRPEQALEALARANDMAPDDPLILLALAEVSLRLDRPAEAMEYAARAETLAPELPQAHDLTGTILLRQGLPALAADAFSRAVSLAPGKAGYLIHRASAHLILEQAEAFCADSRAACALGDCEGYQWARASEKCPARDMED